MRLRWPSLDDCAHGGRRAALRALLCALPLAALADGTNAVTVPVETAVKAAYLYRLLSYVDWPPAVLEGGGPFGIGVVQADDILEELQRVLPGRTVHGRPVLARRLAEGDALDGLHVVLVGGSSRRAASWMRVLRDRRMLLTVTDAAGGLATGSILNFVETDGKVRFEASLVAAEKAELKLSSRLLAVAVRVETKE